MSEPRRAPIRFWGGDRAAPQIAWGRVENALAQAYVYWFATSNGTGRPQPRPVWGLWYDDGLILTVGSTTAWRNVGANPNVSVHLPSGSEVVVLEGTASVETDQERLAPFLERYNAKYSWNLTPDDPGGFIAIAPATLLAWIATPLDTSAGGETLFPRAASKWVWD